MGVIIAVLIFLSWASHLFYLLLFPAVNFMSVWFWVNILVQTWLFTGLFITAHDAMHGTVTTFSRLNNLIGFLAALFFAGMWYPKLVRNHKLHHAYPATSLDPDYKVGNQNFFVWWIAFMKKYITIWQILIMAISFNVGLLFFSEAKLLLFWILPSILATFQLFYFGTYLPHKLPHLPEMEPYKARSQSKNHLFAMFSCYFFGYHYEHHTSPQTPWWLLYTLKK